MFGAVSTHGSGHVCLSFPLPEILCARMGPYEKTRDSEQGSEKVLGRILGNGSQKGSRCGFCMESKKGF